MKNWHKAAVIALAAATGLSASACNSQSTKKTEIRFSTWDSAESLDFQQSMVDKFNEQSETVHVTLEGYGENYDTKITASMGGKDAPDVMYMWNYPKYGEALMPLDELITAEGDAYKNDFYESLWNYNKIGDDILGIPVGYTTHVMYYNKDMFDAAGIAYPTGDWTWEEVEAAAAKLTKPEEKIYGLAIPINPDPYDYEMFAWSNGGAFCDETGKIEGVLNSAETVAPFDFFQKMIADGVAVGTDSYGASNFKMQTVGMFMNGSWSIGSLQEAGINFGIALLPNFGTTPSQSIVSSSGVGISATTEHKEAAWEFVKFWTGKEMNKERIGYELPVLKSVAAEEALLTDEINGKFYTMLERSTEHMPASFLVSDWSTLAEKLNLALEQVLNINEAMDAQQAFDAAAK